jgi:uncharacterized protein YciI
MKRMPLVLFAVASCFLFGPLYAQDKPTAFEMTTYYMVRLEKGTNWSSESTAESKKLQADHIAYLEQLGSAGKGLIAGPMGDDSNLRGILVLNVATLDEARQLASADPAVRAGRFVPRIHPWYAAKGIMKAPELPFKMSTYYLGFLRRGPKWTPERTPETARIQEGHMANINRLAKTGKLVLAGPFTDDGEIRGVFIFKTESAEEAKMLADSDPAVSAGRLVLELHPWMVGKGALP